MSAPRSQGSPTFAWQCVLLSLPVLVFAVLGVVLLSRDRLAVQREAEADARVLADQVANFVGERFSRCIHSQLLRTLQRNERVLPPGTGLSEGENGETYELSAARYQEVLDLQTNWGHGALEPANGLPRLIVNDQGDLVWPRPYPPTPAPEIAATPGTAAGRYHTAMDLLAAGKNAEAIPVLAALAANMKPLLSEAGIPVQPLAALALLRQFDSTNQATPAVASQLASNAVLWPSLLTDAFLNEAVQAWPGPREDGWESGPVWWRQFWWVEEEARAMHEHLRAVGKLPSAAGRPMIFQIEWRGKPWVIVCASRVAATNGTGNQSQLIGLHFYPEALVEMCLLAMLDQSRVRVPPYASVVFTDGNRYWPETPSLPSLASSPMTWQFSGKARVNGQYDVELLPLSGLSVQVRLAKPEMLFARQRNRQLVLGALILVSLLVASIGLLTAYRSFCRQLRLNEMKSNFVSSVSHELRAPIASVRLMAESLERGKISSAEKRSEYFRFIGQECRRLSALIENVLDFSRIEQGRKQYEFEPTDLGALVAQTVKLMEPYAAEKGVRLETLNLEPRTSNLELSVDGRALQQALVNLIDNAIKHSPKDSAVAVNLDTNHARRTTHHDSAISHPPSTISLSVSDHGPGVPASEHELIFERFYRLGSELRRETPGVGIGLSIVKHIVEAHGGHVRVESESGKGSRFTIELPVKQNLDS